jgi:hypothetical protein
MWNLQKQASVFYYKNGHHGVHIISNNSVDTKLRAVLHRSRKRKSLDVSKIELQTEKTGLVATANEETN